MNKYLSVIKKSPLFSGVVEKEIESMLGCLSAVTLDYKKNQFVFRFDRTDALGLVLSGSVHVIHEDFWGNRNILSKIAPGQLFAETYASTQGVALGIGVIATEPTSVIFLNVRRILTTCPSGCEFHSRLIRNLLSVIAEKNLLLNDKITHMSRRTTREKLLSYLSAESIRQNSSSFNISFNRQQLADYLSVDRSAMSNALCKMRNEGLLSFSKSHFELKGNR
jgi:CRP-like cAMP-binding protein